MPDISTASNFLSAVNVGSDNRAEELIDQVDDDAVLTAYRCTMNNIKNTEKRGGPPSEYRSMLAIIQTAMNARNISLKTSRSR